MKSFLKHEVHSRYLGACTCVKISSYRPLPVHSHATVTGQPKDQNVTAIHLWPCRGYGALTAPTAHQRA